MAVSGQSGFGKQAGDEGGFAAGGDGFDGVRCAGREGGEGVRGFEGGGCEEGGGGRVEGGVGELEVDAVGGLVLKGVDGGRKGGRLPFDTEGVEGD